MKYGITFGETTPQPGMSFGYWDISKDEEYNFDKHYQNLQRELNSPPIEFLEGNRLERTGKSVINTRGSYVETLEYVGCYEVYSKIITEHPNGDVKFYLKSGAYREFKEGAYKGPFDKSIYSTGYMGYGKFCRKDYTLFYDLHHDMMKRSCSGYFKNNHPEYRDVTVEPVWHNLQTFGKWCEENYYTIPGQRMNLDKDILIKGNRIYGPDRCVIVPSHINSLFTKNDKFRNDLPIGVHIDEYGKFKVQIQREGIVTFLGYVKDPIEGFYIYKEAKEKEIKRVADLYKQWIPERLYIVMYNYQVEITD